MAQVDIDRGLAFLAGGGEMGARIRAFDWSKTPLGPADTWPQSLRSPLSMMLPSKAQIILFWGPDFTVFYNDAYRPVFGAKHPQALGQPGREAWSEIWDAVLHELLAGVVRTGEAFWAKDLLFTLERHGFAEETYFDVSYDPVRVESGEVGGVFCIVTETTERVVGARRMSLLKDLAAQHTTARATRDVCTLATETLAAKAQDVLFALVYLDGELQSCTPGAEEQLAVTPPDLVRTLSLFSQEADGRSGSLVVGLNQRRPFDDLYRQFLDVLASQFSTTLSGARAYEDETRRAEALAEIDRAKTTFFSNVSHEFRTPLTLMLGPLEDLAERPQTAATKETLTLVRRNGQRLLKLVNTLLDFSRIEAGRMAACYEPTDLAAYTTELASMFRSATDKAGLELVIDCEPLAEPIHVDRDMWEKIVLNLVSNAFKYTFEGAITVRLRGHDSRVDLSVSDTGIGIPHAELPRMFERFHRATNVRSRSHEGTGIGLAFVRELARLHGGEVSVESEEGRGTTFTVTIPTGTSHLRSDLMPADRTSQGQRRKEKGKRETGDGVNAFVEEALRWLPGEDASTDGGLIDMPEAMAEASRSHAVRSDRILLADDNADMREYVRRLLAHSYTVDVVADGQAALDRIRTHPPDLVVADVMMPSLDGFGMLAAIRADERLRALPVMLLSARAGQESHIEGLQAGADAYLVKPFSARELVARVGSMLDVARLRKAADAALRESEQKFRALTGATSDAVYRMSADWREMRQLQGRQFIADTLEPSRSWMETYILPADRPQVLAAINKAIRTKRMFELEHRVIRVDGSPGWTHSRAIPILDAHGTIVEWFGAASDVTARKEAERALVEADQRKDEFIAMLAHELRNPLAPIRMGMELIRLHGDNPEAVARVRGMMERQIGHMVRLIDDLLDVSRISSGKIRLRRQLTPLTTLVQNAVEISRAAAAAKNITLTVLLPEQACVLDVDPTRFVQILSNLLHNATKFTPSGGMIRVAGSIRNTGRRRRPRVKLSVADSGVGIASPLLPRVFDLFTQGHSESSQPGLGIGLALARQLVEMHGGRITARSDGEGQGSEFVVELTCRTDAAVQPDQPTSSPGLTGPARRIEGRRVFVIDDNEDAANATAMLVQALGGESRVAHNAERGLDEVLAYRPDAVLLDIGLPGIDGYEACRRIRRELGDQVLLVALTGFGQPHDKEMATRAGFNAHVTKPAAPAVLATVLAATAGLKPPEGGATA